MHFLFFFFFFSLFIIFFMLGFFFYTSYSYVLEFFLYTGDYMVFSFVFFFDFISLFFFSFISLISSIVFLYSKFYMSYFISISHTDNSRFFYLLFLFVFSMFFLVFSGSWLVMMLGWDGLGLVSFLLVVYYSNSSSLDSGLLTIFTNRIGDSFFIFSFIFLFFSGWLSFDFMSLFSSFFILLVFVIGCFTKSAQIPFSSWLPAAMAAPTPVSSLVHSSTLVTAGVYLIIRFNYMLTSVFYLISFFSLVTMFLAGICAMYEKDFKKVVAMSTLSQLGFMIFSISMGFWLISFLHMVFHAFFKSSLFLSTGSLMHILLGDQDSRVFGSLGSSYFSKIFFVSSCISLMGFPFSLGFYSKDLILSSIFMSYTNFFFIFFILSCIFTVGYSFRLIYSSFMSFPSFTPFILISENIYFFFPVIILYVVSLFIGSFFFYYFTIPVLFSFTECFLGVIVLFFGFILFYLNTFFYFMDQFISVVGFLSLVSSPTMTQAYSKYPFYLDYTWLELVGGQGLLKLFDFLYYSWFFIFCVSMSFFFLFFLL